MKPTTFFFAASLSAAVAAPLSAQQPDVRAPEVAAPAAPAVAPAVAPVVVPAVTGPRIRLDVPVVEPALSSSRTLPASYRAPHTITITTITLVLLVVILVLLIS